MNFLAPFSPAALVALASFFVTSARNSAITAALAILVTLLILALLAAYRLQQSVDEYLERPRPHLVFSSTEVQTGVNIVVFYVPVSGYGGPVATGGTSAASASATESHVTARRQAVADFARVVVTNDPAGKPGEIAQRVIARLKVSDVDGNELLRATGRWAEQRQAPESLRIGMDKEAIPIDLDPNALEHELDIAFKYPQDANCYVYNNDNGQYAGDLRYRKHELAGKQFRVDVELQGSNVGPVRASFLLENGGANGSLQLTAVEDA
jgi:hypothetical protein